MAIEFLTASNQWISVADSASLDITTNFSITLWLKTNLNQLNRYILEKSGSATDNVYSLIWEFVNNQIEFFAAGFTGSDPRTGSGLTLPDAGWHHICYCYDGTTWEGYLDGTAVFSVARTFALITGDMELSIGATNTPAAAVDAQMEDLRILNRKVSANEAALLAAGYRGPLGGEVLWLDMGSSRGTAMHWDGTTLSASETLPDRSANTNDGTPTNSPVARASEAPRMGWGALG